MRKLETEIISTENVKPSSPTPHHLQRYNLSMLDQTVPNMLVPIILYYPATSINDPSSETLINQLKDSLSVTLTQFYPLAGRINEDFMSIECDGKGVPFVVAKMNGQKLSDLLPKQEPGLPSRLIPCTIKWDTEPEPGSNVSMFQVTRFDCGGFSIGAVFWHKAADAATVGHFLKCWAKASLGSGYKEPVCPSYVAPSVFPQSEAMQASTGSLKDILKMGKSIMRRYVFDARAISTLKTLAAKDGMISRPSRVEVVSALIWRCFMAASLANGRSASAATHAVNLRRRANPPFSSDCFGNFPALYVASCPNRESTDYELGHLVGKLRESITKIDAEFVSRLVGDDGFSGYQENLGRVWGQIPNTADLLSFSSWCGFGFYEVDFGWGKPVWITRCDAGNDDEESPFFNVVWLMDTRSGDGVEAWVTLEEKYMQIFETIQELTAVACRDPSPVSAHTIQESFKIRVGK